MRHLGGAVRVAAVTLTAAVLAVAATHVSGSVQLADRHSGAGLPDSSTVLVDQSTLVCPGQQRFGAVGLSDVKGDVVTAMVPLPGGLVRGVPSSGAGTAALEAGPNETKLASGTTSGQLVSAPVTAAYPVVARATGALAPGAVATQVWRHTRDDDRGLVVTPCQPPSSDVWLVAGGAGASRTERLIITNPGANAVTASFEIFGREGRIPGTEDHSVSIPPSSRTVISLDAIAPDEPGPVVHVTSTGGVVSAVLDEQWIDGATARGIDDGTRAAPPSKDLVIAGVDISGAAWVRIANLGDTEALVQVRVLTDKGAVQPDALRAVRVRAESTTAVQVPGVTGAVGLGLQSDQPVVAAAWTERRATTGDHMGDFAWAPATPELRGVSGLALPGLSGMTKRLLLTTGPAPASAQVRIGSGPAGRSTAVDVPADSTRVVDLGDADAVWVDPTGSGLRAAVSVVGADSGVPLYSVASLTDAPLRALSLPVRQVRN